MKTFIAFVWINWAWKTTALIDLFESIEWWKIEEFNSWDKFKIWNWKNFMTIWKTFEALWRYERGKTSWSDSVMISDVKLFLKNLDIKDTFLYDWVFWISKPVFDIYRWMKNRWIEIHIIYLIIPSSLAIQRIGERNWWKDIRMDMKQRKHFCDNRILSLKKEYPDFTYHLLRVDKQDIKSEVLKIYKRIKGNN